MIDRVRSARTILYNWSRKTWSRGCSKSLAEYNTTHPAETIPVSWDRVSRRHDAVVRIDSDERILCSVSCLTSIASIVNTVQNALQLQQLWSDSAVYGTVQYAWMKGSFTLARLWGWQPSPCMKTLLRHRLEVTRQVPLETVRACGNIQYNRRDPWCLQACHAY